jgi:hypothetical protein
MPYQNIVNLKIRKLFTTENGVAFDDVSVVSSK